MRVALLLFICLQVLQAMAGPGPAVNIIPRPVSLEMRQGDWVLPENLGVQAPAAAEETARLFADRLGAALQRPVKLNGKGGAANIMLVLNRQPDAGIGTEGYRLEVKPGGVAITANQPAGLFYGMQTFFQLLPVHINPGDRIRIACLAITDYPRFGWRGLMLDVSRHFFPKEMVKRYIDQMVQYKFNVFHWHLTDDAGWRIQINALPELTRTGAWRVPRTGKWKTFDPPQPGEKATEGGYYTQNDIREVLAYAKQRFVTVIPEIDVPAHTQAFIASYPSASCTQLPYPVYPGNTTGVTCNVLCAGNEQNFAMLEKVIAEVAALFPAPYIHIGGDEVKKDFWSACTRCRQRMQQEGLTEVRQLQGYFIKRVKQMVTAQGKQLIGWDEIAEDSVGNDAVIMSWRSPEAGFAAVKHGHRVVMTPRQYYYINDLQGDAAIERIGVNMARLCDIYNFEPAPDSVNQQLLLGGQGNLWTELVPHIRKAEYMTWPRGLALAEVFWSPRKYRSWNDFIDRVEGQLPRFDQAQVNYARSIYDPIIRPVKDADGNMRITFATEVKDLDVYYTFDYSFPDTFSAKYAQQPLPVPAGATEVWAQAYRNGKPAGRVLMISITELKRRMK